MLKRVPVLIRFLSLLLFLTGTPLCAEEPLILGKGVERFKVGPLIYQDDFKNLDRWVVQIENKDGFPAPQIQTKSGTLDCLLPGRGCTIWFKEKLKTHLSISYEVICPSPPEGMKGIEVKDVNNFWLANDPLDPDKGLFNHKRYNGNFTSYNKMTGYYASTGGGRNTTTRMRRYPRERDGRLRTHIALKHRDRQQDFLIAPDKTMKVQLVAFDDLVQYIVDGKLVYEMAYGDKVSTERHRRGEQSERMDDYEKRDYPIHREGFFGFRMVGTHHIYSKFRVHELKEIPPPTPVDVAVSTLDELREAAKNSHQNVTMTPGHYVVKKVTQGEPAFNFTGSHNSFDLTGVTIEMPIAMLSKMAGGRHRSSLRTYLLSGNKITLRGGLFVNTYPYKLEDKIDFGAYNQNPINYPSETATEMLVRGDDIRLEGCKMIVRGSSPYGYGNMFGIGGGAVLPLRKHSGILIHGDRAILDGCEVKMEAFGHAIFTQYADGTLVKNCYVEGEVRPSNDFLVENDEGDLAKKYRHQIQWPDSVRGLKVPKNHMINLVEDGIRAYSGTGRITVENCKVVRTRGGIKLYMAKAATIRNCEVLDCVIQGFSVPRKGIIVNCRGNAAYGPLFYVHNDSYTSQKIEIEVLPAPHGIGDHPLAAIKGKDHRIKFTSKNNKGAQLRRPIIIGYPMRFDFLSWDFPKVPAGMESLLKKFGPERYTAERIHLQNETPYPVVLGEHSKGNQVISQGKINDLGSGNKISLSAKK
ncbi:MAG: right-handed parallel beta-helix repeat-containing protein [Akkermansiaceae bacterium]